MKSMGQGAALALMVGAMAMGLPASGAENFKGWQDMRIVQQQALPDDLHVVDLNGDGREEMLLVDRRQSRLLLYRWLPKADRKPVAKADTENPNELPMAPEFEREEIALEDLPSALVAADVVGDKHKELIVMTSPPGKVVMLKFDPKAKDKEKQWVEHMTWDVEEGATQGTRGQMLLRPIGDEKKKQYELLLGYADGIKRLELKKDAKAIWMSPREREPRMNWWLIDLDGDGDDDLVEWSRVAVKTIRWYENVKGELAPGTVLSDEAVVSANVLRRKDGKGEVVLLCRVPSGSLRRYGMGFGEASPVGQKAALPVKPATGDAWCGITLGGKPSLAYVDSQQPRLLVHALGKHGWEDEQSYPIVSNVQAIASLPGKSGALLLWAKDAGDLYMSQWEKGRLTYPKLWEKSPETKKRRIITLQKAADLVWWAQQVDDDLDLYVWANNADKPEVTRFKGLGESDKVAWLGGERLLVMEKYARNAKLAVVEDGEVKTSEPGHLKNVSMSEFVLFGSGKDLKLGRMTDGVLQWLGDDLHPVDQVMLPDGKRLGGIVTFPKQSHALATEQGGGKLHRLEPDKAGILRVAKTYDLKEGGRLENNPALGLLLVTDDRVTHISEGKPRELELTQSLTTQTDREAKLDKVSVNRMFLTDVTGDGQTDILLIDDDKHKLTLVSRGDKGLGKSLTWDVFEDSSYPYGGGGYGYGEEIQREPRDIVGLDLDGDGHQDLAMLCHDRILIYLGRKEQP